MTLADLLASLEHHVGAGRLDDLAHRRLRALREGFPAECRAEPGPLFRAMTIEADHARALRAGQPVTLEAIEHSCWTRANHLALGIARMRAEQEPERAIVIMRRETLAADSLDIQACFRWLRADIDEITAWALYARHEQEVVLAHDAPFSIAPEEVLEIWMPGAEMAERIKPRIGETFSAFGDDHVVEEVLGDVPDIFCTEVRAGSTIYPIFFEPEAASGSGLICGGIPRPV